jgi:hypothetical protein
MTGAVQKYQARLNINGTSMKYGVHFSKTHSPLASCVPLRMLLTLTGDHCWYTIRLDAKHPFAHAPVKTMVHIKVPAGVKLDNGRDPRY